MWEESAISAFNFPSAVCPAAGGKSDILDKHREVRLRFPLFFMIPWTFPEMGMNSGTSVIKFDYAPIVPPLCLRCASVASGLLKWFPDCSETKIGPTKVLGNQNWANKNARKPKFCQNKRSENILANRGEGYGRTIWVVTLTFCSFRVFEVVQSLYLQPPQKAIQAA